uniref:Uncharacterized protein n=1 Tax=Ditylenchus dipsaci TaxID=166011 RepID=A0A915DYP5_9BILA
MEEVCATRVPDKNGVYPPLKCELRQAEDIRGELARLLYYKYLTWAEKGGQHRQRALYVNGRDVYSLNNNESGIAPVPTYNQVIDAHNHSKAQKTLTITSSNNLRDQWKEVALNKIQY